MGGLYKHYPVMQASWMSNVLPVHVLLKSVSPDTCAAGGATQRTDFPALVMRLCVLLLLLKRGATTPSSLNTVKTKLIGSISKQ